MAMRYSDPYKDDKFGKVKGDKRLEWFQVYFDEGKLHKTDDGYALDAHFTGYQGVQHSFGKNGEQAPAGLAVLHIYAKEHEVRKSTGKKDDNGKWIYESHKEQPSIYEAWLCKHIEDNPAVWLPESQSISGNITFPLNPQVASMSESQQSEYFATCYQISSVPTTDKVPEWQEKQPYRRNGFGGKGVSIEDKVNFLKQELRETVDPSNTTANFSLGQLVYLLVEQHREQEQFLVCYMDLLKAVAS